MVYKLVIYKLHCNILTILFEFIFQSPIYSNFGPNLRVWDRLSKFSPTSNCTYRLLDSARKLKPYLRPYHSPTPTSLIVTCYIKVLPFTPELSKEMVYWACKGAVWSVSHTAIQWCQTFIFTRRYVFNCSGIHGTAPMASNSRRPHSPPFPLRPLYAFHSFRARRAADAREVPYFLNAYLGSRHPRHPSSCRTSRALQTIPCRWQTGRRLSWESWNSGGQLGMRLTARSA